MAKRQEKGISWKVTRKMVEKWIMENDKTFNTTLWLKFEVVVKDSKHVLKLNCSICA